MKKPIFNINIYKPESKKEKRGYEPGHNFIIFWVIIALLIPAIVSVYLFFGIHMPQKQRLENAYSEEDSLEQKLQGLKDMGKRLIEKKEFYLGLKAESVSWPEKMSIIGNITPDSIWFSKIEFPGRLGQIKGGQNILVSGATFSGFMEENLDQIGNLLLMLNQSQAFKREFDSLNLDFTKKSDSEWGATNFQYSGKTKDFTTSSPLQ